MPNMKPISQRALDTLLTEDPEFVALAELLYGEPSEPSKIIKREGGKSFQEKVAAGSNALGLTAGAAAIGSTLQDKRLNHVHASKTARRLYKTGQKIPAPIRNAVSRMTPKHRAMAAVGAAGLQGANVIGDIVVSQTLPKGDKKVSKAIIPIGTLANGAYQAQKRTIPEALQATGKKLSRSNRFGQALHAPIEHPKLTAAGVGLYGTGKMRGQAKGRQQGYNEAVYGKADAPDLELAGTFSKFDDDKRQAFGYASVVKKDGQPVIDRQGDYIDADQMEMAAYHYVQKSRKGGDMHRRVTDEFGQDAPHHVSDLIESMVFTPEKCKAMGLPDEVAKKLDGHWWVGYQIHDDATWQEVRKNGRTGFSIHGRGKRVDTTTDEIMGYRQ